MGDVSVLSRTRIEQFPTCRRGETRRACGGRGGAARPARSPNLPKSAPAWSKVPPIRRCASKHSSPATYELAATACSPCRSSHRPRPLAPPLAARSPRQPRRPCTLAVSLVSCELLLRLCRREPNPGFKWPAALRCWMNGGFDRKSYSVTESASRR